MQIYDVSPRRGRQAHNTSWADALLDSTIQACTHTHKRGTEVTPFPTMCVSDSPSSDVLLYVHWPRRYVMYDKQHVLTCNEKKECRRARLALVPGGGRCFILLLRKYCFSSSSSSSSSSSFLTTCRRKINDVFFFLSIFLSFSNHDFERCISIQLPYAELYRGHDENLHSRTTSWGTKVASPLRCEFNIKVDF